MTCSKRIFGAGVALLLSMVGYTTLNPSSADAASEPVFAVMNTSETLPDGVYFRNSSAQNDTNREPGFGVYMGESLHADCWSWGDAVGPYSNHIWYRGLDVTRPTVNGHSNYGFMNTHYVNDGMSADQVYPGIPACAGATPTPVPEPNRAVTPCVFQYKWPKTTITWNYAGKHIYLGNAWRGAQNWNDAKTGITLLQVPGSQAADITFKDVKAGIKGYLGQAQKPTGWTIALDYRTYRSFIPSSAAIVSPKHIDINLNRDYLDNTDLGKMDIVRSFTATHELGHALGMAHSNLCSGLSPDTNSPYHFSVMQNDVPASADIITLSWMLSRYPTSIYDRTELEMLYGLPLR